MNLGMVMDDEAGDSPPPPARASRGTQESSPDEESSGYTPRTRARLRRLLGLPAGRTDPFTGTYKKKFRRKASTNAIRQIKRYQGPGEGHSTSGKIFGPKIH